MEEYLSLEQTANFLQIDWRRLRQLVKDHHLSTLRNDSGQVVIPTDFLVKKDGTWEVLESLRGTLLVLLDGGYDIDEATRWMLRPSSTLGGISPAKALQQGQVHTVRTAASLSAF